MTELQILNLLAENGGSMEYIALLNAIPAPPTEAEGFLLLLRSGRYILGSFRPGAHVVLSEVGYAYRLKLRKEVDEHAHHRAYVRSENHCAKVIAVIAAVAGVVAALFSVLAYFCPR